MRGSVSVRTDAPPCSPCSAPVP
ncbi:hypothetical protein EYF80_050535 [Liparis tanakae]|uniref:Uncharacterized protein n=1 Tax=Liparis tanakae TaxID=230148 RepID=A0A4Z2FEV1_9TELE|nr:hypothetical protein EYF80_050535 [Liparis tanakae]